MGPFKRSVIAALKAGTLIAGPLLTVQQKHALAAALMDRFNGQIVTVDEMRASGVAIAPPQLRSVCQSADDLGYGRWQAKAGTIEWFKVRSQEPGLGL